MKRATKKTLEIARKMANKSYIAEGLLAAEERITFLEVPERFRIGDLVQITKDLGPSMSHFTSDCRAIVVASYAQQFGGSNHNSYTLFLEHKGEVSWYKDHQLTYLEHNRGDLRMEWQDVINRRRKQ